MLPTPVNSSSSNPKPDPLLVPKHVPLHFTETRLHFSAKNAIHCVKLASIQQPNAPVVTTLTVFSSCLTSQATLAFPLVPSDHTQVLLPKNVWYVLMAVQSAMVQVWASVQNAPKTARMWLFTKTQFMTSVLNSAMWVSMNSWVLINVCIAINAVKLARRVPLTVVRAEMNQESFISCTHQTDKINAWWHVQ